jgi:addiction module RelB/DinJ family antitoxin
VLWGIGLNMSEAVELFLRRVIADQKIPFELIALETTQIDMLPEEFSAGESVRSGKHSGMPDINRSSRSASNTRAAKKNLKSFWAPPYLAKNRGKKSQKTPLSEAL